MLPMHPISSSRNPCFLPPLLHSSSLCDPPQTSNLHISGESAEYTSKVQTVEANNQHCDCANLLLPLEEQVETLVRGMHARG